MIKKNPIKRSEKGQGLVELAVSFLVLVLILAVAVDLGRVFFSFIALREAAEEGALFASLEPDDSPGGLAAIEDRVRDNSDTPVDLTDTSAVVVDIDFLGDLCAGNQVAVTVTYTFNLTMPLLGAIIGTQTFPLAADATSTILAPACP
ncbi:MAG: TadE/TadG family type IV pilus assembly protein [Anaerolineales bacterium]